jgi:hypothetical protein
VYVVTVAIPRPAVRLLIVALALSACSPATPEPSPTTQQPRPTTSATSAPATSAPATPSTSSAQVTVEESDVGIESVRTLNEAIAQGDSDAALAMLGPQTQQAVGGGNGLQTLGDMLAPLVGEQPAPFDDVIVAQTPEQITHLVVLGDGDTPTPVAAEVVRNGDQVTVELSPPVPSHIDVSVSDRRRIEIATPPARDIEMVVDGFHFHPSVADDGRSAVMNLPYPLSRRNHMVGVWYGGEAASGVGAATVAVDGD